MERILGQVLDPATTHVFLCGNPKMIGVPEKDRQTGARVYPQPPGVIEILEQRRNWHSRASKDPCATHAVWVSLLYAVPPLVAAWLVFRRRDVAS